MVYVVMWAYADLSGCGAVSAHATVGGAEEMLRLMRKICPEKAFVIEVVRMWGLG